MTDWASLHAEHVRDLGALARSLDDDALLTTVPATPAWTVHDVLAHLAGGAADQVAGRTDGAPGPTWTARHVGERRGVGVLDLVDELARHAPQVGASLGGSASPGPLWDLAVHHADLHEALGRPAPAAHLWEPLLPTIVPRVLAGLPVQVHAGDRVWGDGEVLLTTTPYELFRTVFSRRSQRQVRAWVGDALDDEQLAALGVFGPRDDDQQVPAT